MDSLNKTKTYVFVDACVIQAAGDSDKDKSDAIIKCFSDLTTEGYNLAISEITLFENLQGLWGQRAKKVTTRLKGFEWKVISNPILMLAAILQGLYMQEKRNDIDTGDKILAATAILENGLILTENHKDFPTPFFITKKSIPVIYLKNTRTRKTIDLALYEPNIPVLNHRINDSEQ